MTHNKTGREILKYINKLKKDIKANMKRDRAVDSLFENYARLEVCKKIEKYILKIKRR